VTCGRPRTPRLDSVRVRDRSLYEIASIFFAAVVILFAVTGMLVVGLGDDGPDSAGFLVCTLFLLLGLGRLYLGMRRGEEGTDEGPPAPSQGHRARVPPRRAPRSRPRR